MRQVDDVLGRRVTLRDKRIDAADIAKHVPQRGVQPLPKLPAQTHRHGLVIKRQYATRVGTARLASRSTRHTMH